MTHYYSTTQDSPLRITPLTATLRGNEFSLDSGSGVFSVGRIDKGTRLLIEKAEIPEKGRILDLGCGYGAVGTAIAKAYPLADVVMTDINPRAVFLAKGNASKNNVKVTAVQGDGFSGVTGTFDTILLNPPQSAGKKLCLRLMTEAKQYLKKGGSLQAVMRHKIGGKDMSEKIREVFSNCETISIQSGYRIYKFTAL